MATRALTRQARKLAIQTRLLALHGLIDLDPRKTNILTFDDVDRFITLLIWDPAIQSCPRLDVLKEKWAQSKAWDPSESESKDHIGHSLDLLSWIGVQMRKTWYINLKAVMDVKGLDSGAKRFAVGGGMFGMQKYNVIIKEGEVGQEELLGKGEGWDLDKEKVEWVVRDIDNY